MIPSPEIKELALGDYLKIITKRSWIVVLCLAIGIAGVILYSAANSNIFAAEVIVELRKSPLKLLNPSETPLTPEQLMREDYQAKKGLFQSQTIIERVTKKLSFSISPAALLSIIDIVPVEDSNIVFVKAQGTNPQEITEIANTLVNELIQQEIEINSTVAEYGVGRLEDQISDTLIKLKQSEKELSDFIKNNGDMVEQDEAYQRLKKQRIMLEEVIVAESSRFGDKHQKIISLKKQMGQLSADFAEAAEERNKIRDLVSEYEVLKQQSETFKSLYEELTWRSERLDAAGGLVVSDIKVLDYARVPDKPIPAMPFKRKMYTIFASLFLGILLAFYLENQDKSLKMSEEVEFYTKLPFLGYVPNAGGFRDKEKCLVSNDKPQSLIAEAFRNIKVSLLFASSDEEPVDTIIVTSSLPKEGKTLAASNLAITFAHGGEKTLIIDADLRGGKLAEMLDVKSKKGLSEILKGKAKLEEVVTDTKIENLSVLPSGTHIPNSADVLSSDAFKKAMTELKKTYKKIIIDVPAVMPFTDFMFWAHESDLLLLVVKAGSTQLDVIKEAKAKFDNKISFKGAVLNKAAVESDMKYYEHYFKTIAKKIEKKK